MPNDGRSSGRCGALAEPLRFGLMSVAVGAAFGLLDVARIRLLGPALVLPAGRIPELVLTHAVLWGAAAIPLALGARLLVPSRARSARSLILLAGSGWLWISAAANRHLVGGGATSAPALALDLVLFAIAAGIVIRLVRSGRAPDHLRVWGPVLVVSLAVSFVLPALQRPKEQELAVTAAPGSRPNVLFLLVDALRRDHLSLYGYERETSPNLDRFSRGAVVFRNARAESNWTKPSTATVLTGLPPFVHGQVSYERRLRVEAVTLPEVFRAAGYRTAGFSDNVLISPQFGMDQGFERFEWREGWLDDVFLRETLVGGVFQLLGLPEPRRLLPVERDEGVRGAAVLNESFLGWLDGLSGEEPWFAYLHYMEPHTPYDAPGDWRLRYSGQKDVPPGHRKLGYDHQRPWDRAPELPDAERQLLIDLYDGEIAWWDRCFGELLGELREREATDDLVIVVVSDHGQEFYEHGGWEHRQSLYEEVLRVPLVVRAPDLEAADVDETVSTAGVFATVLGLAGLELADESSFPRSSSLLPPPERDAAVFAGYVPGEDMESLSLVREGMKWIFSRRGREQRLEGYDLRSDPGETDDLAPGRFDEAQAAKREMLRRLDLQLRLALETETAAPGRSVEEELRGLGYLR